MRTATVPRLTLCGGVPHHASLVALWHDDRLTDFAVSAEGVGAAGVARTAHGEIM